MIRHAEPRDAEPLHMLMAHPEVYHDTLQIPYPSMEAWQEKLQPRPHTFHLVATLDEQVAGHLSLHVEPRPRRSHVATFGMAVAAGHQ
ncbi:GNAT family N-acetyltransferase, partial [Klebsiella pneumoniae]|nr:GNAT family N-acetyltransferase [Klebsiella pneumoniae]